MPPVKDLTAATALKSLAEFMAEISKLKGEQVSLVEVLADNVPFNSVEFKHGLTTWPTGPVKLTNTSSNGHRQAGRVERMHGVRMCTANVLMSYARIPATWWPFAVNMANQQANMLPSSHNMLQAPHELVSQDKPDWSGMHVFGTPATIQIPPATRTVAKQVAPRAQAAIYLGPV